MESLKKALSEVEFVDSVQCVGKRTDVDDEILCQLCMFMLASPPEGLPIACSM